MIVLLNGAFGIGKTTVARLIVARLEHAILFDPEVIGIALQRTGRLVGRHVEDFQDFPAWRRLTIGGIRLVRTVRPNVIVPMTFSNPAYLQEVRTAISRFEPRVFHFCLVAPVQVVHARLRRRGADPAHNSWEYRRASECCTVHRDGAFATHISASDREPHEVAQEIVDAITSAVVSR